MGAVFGHVRILKEFSDVLGSLPKRTGTSKFAKVLPFSSK